MLEFKPTGGGRERPLRPMSKNVSMPDLDIDLDALAWQDEAKCRGSDTEKFFPERGASQEAAKAICKECVVSEICLEFAITRCEPGIWGGTNDQERLQKRKERRLPEAS